MPEFHVKLEQLSNNLLPYICKRPSQEPHYQTNLFVADNPIRIWLLKFRNNVPKIKKKPLPEVTERCSSEDDAPSMTFSN